MPGQEDDKKAAEADESIVCTQTVYAVPPAAGEDDTQCAHCSPHRRAILKAAEKWRRCALSVSTVASLPPRGRPARRGSWWELGRIESEWPNSGRVNCGPCMVGALPLAW